MPARTRELIDEAHLIINLNVMSSLDASLEFDRAPTEGFGLAQPILEIAQVVDLKAPAREQKEQRRTGLGLDRIPDPVCPPSGAGMGPAFLCRSDQGIHLRGRQPAPVRLDGISDRR